MSEESKKYIIVKDRHPRISEVLNDCVKLCVPTYKNEPLSSILQKICAKVTGLQTSLAREYFLEAGDNIEVTGDGSSATPWIVSADVPTEFNLFIEDTNTGDLNGDGTESSPLTLDVIVSELPNNSLLALESGLYNPNTIQAGVVYGGIVTWLEGYTYHVSEARYYINGVLYTSPATEITLSPPDLTDNRIDTFILNTSSVATVLEGTPSPTPSQAPLDPATQLEISISLVEVGTTEPTLGIECLYKENTEWTSASSNLSYINTDSSTNPCFGVKTIEGTGVISNVYFTLTRSSAFTPASIYTQLTFFIRNKGSWLNSRYLSFQWQLGNTNVGAVVKMFPGSFGFVASNTTTCQVISIPMSNFGLGPLTSVDRLKVLTFAGTGGLPGYYMDEICLQDVAIVPIPSSPDEKVKVSLNDTVAGYLNGKLVAGAGITLTELNNGGNETFSISAIPGAGGELLTADNGLTENVPNNVQLGGPLITNTSIDLSTFALNFDDTVGSGSIQMLPDSFTGVGTQFSVTSVTGTLTSSATINGTELTLQGVNSATSETYYLTVAAGGAGLNYTDTVNTYRVTVGDAIGGTGIELFGLPNASTQNRLVGVTSATNLAGYITIGSGLSLASGILSSSGILGITADNGLTANTATNVRLGGTLVTGTTINSSTFSLTISGSSTPLITSSTGSYGAAITSTSVGSPGLYVRSFNTNTSTTDEVIRIVRSTTGTAGNGIGSYINFYTQRSDGTFNTANSLSSKWTTATAGTEVSQFGISGVNAGVSADLFILSGSGALQLNKYGVNSFTGTYAKYLAVTSAGNVIEVDAGAGGEVISADNGLTENVPGNVQLGGTLLASTTIATVANTLTISTATASINPLSVLAGTGTALVATSSGGLATVNVTNSSSGFGIQATGTTNAAIFATSTGGSGISAFSTNALAGEFVINPASTNSIVEAVRIVRNTSGTASNSIGLSVDMYNETDSGTIRVTNQIISKLTTAADAARVSQFILTGVDNAVTADLFALSGNGSLQLNKYGVGLFTTGVPIYNLSVTSTGQVIETLPGAAGEIISADNGLTENVPGNVQLGGTLINATTTVAGGTNVMQFTTSNGGLFEYSFGTFSASNTANTAALTSSSTDGVAGIFDVNPATTNTVVNSVYVRRLTSGTAANNIGVGLQFVVENSIGSTVNSNQFVSQLTNVTSGSETSRFILRGINSSVSVDALTILGSGSTRLNSYGVGTFTGTAAYTLQVDASGNIIEGSLSGSTNIYNSDGSLTANRTVTNAGFSLTVNNNTATTTLAVNNTSTGIALSGTSTSNIGVNGVSTNQQGVVGTSSSSYGVWGVSTSSIGGVFNVNPSSTNTIVEAVRLLRATSGTAANGIGAYLGILAENSDGTSNEIAKVAAAWTDVTVGTRTGDLQFWTTNSATSAVKMTIAGSGTVTLHGTAYTGLGAGYLAVDNAGVLSWNAGTGGASNVYTADGTLTGNRTMTLSGNTFRALQATEEYFLIDPTANNEAVLLQAINTTGSNNTAFYSGLTTASDGTASIGTTFNGTNIGRVQTFSDTSGSLNTYVATAHEFTGNVRSSANNTDDLGSASISWKDIYTRTVKFDGSTSGTVTIQAAAVAGTPTLTLPTVTGTVVQYVEGTTASSATPTPTGDARENYYDVTALATNATFGAPTGTAANHNSITIRVKDDGTARTLAFNAIYRAGTDIAFPTTTVVSETMYLQFIYNSADTKWDFIGFTQGFA